MLQAPSAPLAYGIRAGPPRPWGPSEDSRDARRKNSRPLGAPWAKATDSGAPFSIAFRNSEDRMSSALSQLICSHAPSHPSPFRSSGIFSRAGWKIRSSEERPLGQQYPLLKGSPLSGLILPGFPSLTKTSSPHRPWSKRAQCVFTHVPESFRDICHPDAHSCVQIITGCQRIAVSKTDEIILHRSGGVSPNPRKFRE